MAVEAAIGRDGKRGVGESSVSGFGWFSRWRRIRSGVGELPKRSNGSDCKSDGYAFTGSNPVLPTKKVAAATDERGC